MEPRGSGKGGDLRKPPMPERRPASMPGFGTKGRQMTLLTNHFRVSVSATDHDKFFYHYHVNLKYEDGQPVDQGGVCRRVISRLQETYASELAGKSFAHDGETSLFTIGPLPQTDNAFTVVLENASSGSGFYIEPETRVTLTSTYEITYLRDSSCLQMDPTDFGCVPIGYLTTLTCGCASGEGVHVAEIVVWRQHIWKGGRGNIGGL